MRKLTIALFFAAALLPVAAAAQNPVSWRLESSATGKSSRDIKSFRATLLATIEDSWHLYDIEQPGVGPFPTAITMPTLSAFAIDGKVSSTGAITQFDPSFKIDTRYFDGKARFDVPVKFESDGRVDDLAINVRYQVCNDTICLPPKTVRVTFNGFEDEKKSPSAGSAAETAQKPPTARPIQRNTTAEDLWPFLWLAFTLGALSLLTPCVFPMIPITVSYFTNHSRGSRSRAVQLAAVYCFGIISTFTLVGMLLAIFVGAAGVNLFAANPWINILITSLFLFFAFSLFGAYEISIPSGLLTKLDRVTRTREGQGSGVLGALLMGLTFTLTSFTCTSPFVGTILVSASQGDWQRPFIGMLAYSAIFALPFFVLALVPQWVAQIPRAGGWMNSIKVAMGFLEVAAAMKFISNVDLVWKWGIFTRGVLISTWIAIAIILSLYLLGKFQLAHDSRPERIGVFRLGSAIVSLSVAFYLLTGLFGAKLGEIEAFLPPDLASASRTVSGNASAEPAWIVNDYPAALAQAKASKKRVFIDFTGYTCTNCRWMEANIFPRPEVSAQLEKFVLSRLYTDGDGELFARQQKMEQEMFGTVALPFYAILDGDGNIISTFPGLTRNAAEFTAFLRAGAGS